MSIEPSWMGSVPLQKCPHRAPSFLPPYEDIVKGGPSMNYETDLSQTPNLLVAWCWTSKNYEQSISAVYKLPRLVNSLTMVLCYGSQDRLKHHGKMKWVETSSFREQRQITDCLTLWSNCPQKRQLKIQRGPSLKVMLSFFKEMPLYTVGPCLDATPVCLHYDLQTTAARSQIPTSKDVFW